jgi:hypothetical protein
MKNIACARYCGLFSKKRILHLSLGRIENIPDAKVFALKVEQPI